MNRPKSDTAAAIRKASPGAESLLEHFRRLAHHWFLRAGLTQDDADDCLQDGLLLLVGRTDIVNPAGWLNLFLRHRLIDRLRADQKLAGPAEKRVATELAHPSVDIAMAVHEVLGALPARQARLLILRYCFGFNDHEVAERMHMAPSSVSRLTLRALERARKLLETDISSDKQAAGSGEGASTRRPRPSNVKRQTSNVKRTISKRARLRQGE